jgi:hypothetical protein
VIQLTCKSEVVEVSSSIRKKRALGKMILLSVHQQYYVHASLMFVVDYDVHYPVMMTARIRLGFQGSTDALMHVTLNVADLNFTRSALIFNTGALCKQSAVINLLISGKQVTKNVFRLRVWWHS